MITGTGFWIWKVRDCEGGDPVAIASVAHAAGFTHVCIKIADGTYAYNIDPETHTDLALAVTVQLRALGLQVWGWGYAYGYDPVGEARIATQRIHELRLDGYVIDAEAEYKLPGRIEIAKRYTGLLRQANPRLPIALSSYRFPKYHPEFPWEAFLRAVDINMPQVYWEQAHNPYSQLCQCIQEFAAIGPIRPIVPVGPTYRYNGWAPTVADIREFIDGCKAKGLPAYNFFSWNECKRDTPELWPVIADPFKPPEPPKPPDPAHQVFLPIVRRG